MSQPRALGRHRRPNHDPRSRAFPARVTSLRTVVHEHVGPVLDQGNIGSCTGYAAAQAYNTKPLLGAGMEPLGSRQADGLYALGTYFDPYPRVWPGEDTGSSGLAVAKAAHKCGLILSYWHCFGTRHALGALAAGPIIIGVPWFDGMSEPTSEGLLEPTGEILGGHEVAVIGLDVARETVTVLNSWGPGWGIGGTARMRWTVLDQLLKDGGDATVLGAVS